MYSWQNAWGYPTQEINSVNKDKRSLGAYYSPEPYARALVHWALAGRPGGVLDPSFGGCAMLRVALEELEALDARNPARLIFGADIDRSTAMWAAHLASRGVPIEQLRSADFLSITPGTELPKVAAVVGNPPYVRHHLISPATKRRGLKRLEEAQVSMSERASLWAYFVIHSCRFVQPGGRMAFLLPGSVLQANYAANVIGFVQRRFSVVQLVRVSERIFSDANEETVVLLASDAAADNEESRPEAPFAVNEVADIAGLRDLLEHFPSPSPPSPPNRALMDGVPAWKSAIVSEECWDSLAEILGHRQTNRLGDIAKVSLGAVTGANHFFVVTERDAMLLGANEYTIPVVSRSAWLENPELTAQLLQTHSDERGLLLALPADKDIDGRTRLGRYIRDGEDQGLSGRHHCQRDPWWSLGTVAVPDAFLPYMVGRPRGLALNSARAASTNTVHQIMWHEEPSVRLTRSRILSTWSSIGQLSMELFGRHYGGGVLKLELTEAKRIPVISGLNANKKMWTSSQRSSDVARSVADQLLLESKMNITESDIKLFRQTSEALASRREAQRRVSAPKGNDSMAMRSSPTTPGLQAV